MLTDLNGVLDMLKQGPSKSAQRVGTSDTSGEETYTSIRSSSILSKKNFCLKEVYGATELGSFYVTGQTDAANEPNHFCCRVCQKDVSVLRRWSNELLQQFQGGRHFAQDKRLRQETPGWRVPDFHKNPLSQVELD